MRMTLFSTSKSVRDDVKTAFPSLGILNDFHQSFDIVFTDMKMAIKITSWCLENGVNFLFNSEV